MTSEGSSAEAAGMVSVAEACERLNISKWTLYKLISDKRLKSGKIGRRRLVSVSSIVELISELESEGGARK